MAEFDAIAQRELDRRRATVASQPLAKRSLTWSVSGDRAQLAVAKEHVRPASRHRYPKKDFSNIWRW